MENSNPNGSPEPDLENNPDAPVSTSQSETSLADQETVETTVPYSEPSVADTAPSQPIAPKKSHKKLIILLSIFGAVLVLGSIIAIVLLVVLKKEVAAPVVENVSTSRPASEAIGAPSEVEIPLGNFAYIEPVFIDPSVTWQEPAQTSLQGYRKNEIQITDDKNIQFVDGSLQVKYFIAGTFPGGKIVYLQSDSGALDSYTEVYLARDGQKAELLQRYREQFTKAGSDSALDPSQYDTAKVTLNTNTLIKNTFAPETVTIKGQKMSLPKYKNYLSDSDTREYSNRTGSINLFSNLTPTSETAVTTIPEGTIYELTTPKEGYKLSLFELKMANNFRVSYEIDGEISNADIQPITWTDGTRNTASYQSFGAGCGGGRYSLVAELTKNDLTQIGKSDSGQPIYMFKDMNQQVAAKIRSEVNARGSFEKYISETDPPYTAEEFLKDRAVIIVEDGMGRWVIFKNTGNFIQGGCAKPVIYLYPESPLTLDVQVGADVTISEPQYESNGWQSVTALPTGELFYRGLPYGSLFWEGLGHGSYPDKSSYGIIVPQSQVVPTMYRQLAEQGFNQKETDDFIEFWELNIPNRDYVRLTWLSTQEMNELAPLYLSTRPDTVIRTFLEMEGLSRPVRLTPQKFSPPQRQGFVVTEWGGLAIGGLENLTYPE